MREIALTQGKVAIVDDDDYDYLMQFKWYAYDNSGRGFYAAKRCVVDGKGRRLRMHQLLVNGGLGGSHIDHINGNTLDNRRVNLRHATRSQNAANSSASRYKPKTGYRGVYKQKGRFRAQIRVDGRTVHLGYYAGPAEAARVYDLAARQRYGTFARVNFT